MKIHGSDVRDMPKDPRATEQERHLGVIEEQREEEVDKHGLLIWTGLAPGDVASPVTWSSDLVPGQCPAVGQAACSIRKTAFKAATGRRAIKHPLTGCEIGVFLSLAPGEPIVASNHDTGEYWDGHVDITSPNRGIAWIFTQLGERKLVDISIHTIWRPDEIWKC